MNTDLLRHCTLPPHPHKIEPDEIPLRRYGRFVGELGRGGLYDAFLRIKNDELVYFGDVADWLVAAGLDRGSVITRFQLGVRYGEFGYRGSLGQIAELIDLDNFSDALPGCYALRPFITRAVASCEQMRTRKTRWARWLQEQSWPVPGWLAGAPLIKGTATVIDDGRRALPAPVRKHKSARGAILRAAEKLGKGPADFPTFEEYRRELCKVAGVDDRCRGWGEDSVRRAFKVPQVK